VAEAGVAGTLVISQRRPDAGISPLPPGDTCSTQYSAGFAGAPLLWSMCIRS
jgi:hypothetical protein